MDSVVSIFETLIPISFFALIALIVYFTARFRYKLKKAIIEKGGTVEFNKTRFPFLEIGITALGVGVGFLISSLVLMTTIDVVAKDLMTLATIVIFGAAGMIAAFFVRRRLNERGER